MPKRFVSHDNPFRPQPKQLRGVSKRPTLCSQRAFWLSLLVIFRRVQLQYRTRDAGGCASPGLLSSRFRALMVAFALYTIEGAGLSPLTPCPSSGVPTRVTDVHQAGLEAGTVANSQGPARCFRQAGLAGSTPLPLRENPKKRRNGDVNTCAEGGGLRNAVAGNSAGAYRDRGLCVQNPGECASRVFFMVLGCEAPM